MKKTLTVVTGGHGGMGKAICKELGKTSVIVLAGRNLTKMESAKAELDELGIKSYLCKTDIADDAQVQALAEFAASLGDVKQVIHTSGVSPSDTTTENIIRINAIGTVNMVKGEFFRAGLAYAMSKKFVIYFTQKNISRFEFKKRNSLQIGDCFFFEDYSIA